MRTLAHQWVHAHQRFSLGRERGPDIGGQNEDEANAFAGRLIKMFEKEYPDYNQLVFECSEKIVNKINLISEQILLTEKENIKEEFDFIVSRAVTAMPTFINWTKGKFLKKNNNLLKNGILYLKGGDLKEEMATVKKAAQYFNLSDFYTEEFFETKKVVYVRN